MSWSLCKPKKEEKPKNDSPGGAIVMKPALAAKLIRSDGTVKDYGVVSERMITNAFVNYLAAGFTTSACPIAGSFMWHCSGTGSTAEAATDTALATILATPAAASGACTVSGCRMSTVATLAYSNSCAIVEHGLFSASASGTLMDRSVFAAINVVSGDSIQFTYTLTIAAGG